MSSSELVPENADGIAAYAGESWDELTATAYEWFGADLEKGDRLIGVPMCLIRATFRQGDIVNPQTKEMGWYVSLDTIIGPERELAKAERRGRMNPAESQVEPGEHLVFNEGGTGVYRQVVEHLVKIGFVRIDSDAPETGGYGDSRYDVLPPEWAIREDLRAGALTVTDEGTRAIQFDIRLLCPRGLRASDYQNEYTRAGHTRYIA